ncbi:MAG: type I-MYXAN CRISPR-associated protein Cas6/Cmx6 [Deltaproteobacteria bacterium]|nr:type I-MYXAN CRISPR-associated protein Cas6/Cmx6 [Deltaproteobacteria bacterium]
MRESMPYIDLAFRLNGTTIPVDHGYALYAALSRIAPEVHEAKELGVQPIRGVYGGDGKLHLADFSRLILRLPDDQIRMYLTLAGKKLDVDGHSLRIGIPEVLLLRPVASLRARLVTIKGFMETETFLDAVKRQLQDLQVAGEAQIGERKTFRIKDKQVVGFSLGITNLTAEESLTLQEKGLGGRRRMGCGMFVPAEVRST